MMLEVLVMIKNTCWKYCKPGFKWKNWNGKFVHYSFVVNNKAISVEYNQWEFSSISYRRLLFPQFLRIFLSSPLSNTHENKKALFGSHKSAIVGESNINIIEINFITILIGIFQKGNIWCSFLSIRIQDDDEFSRHRQINNANFAIRKQRYYIQTIWKIVQYSNSLFRIVKAAEVSKKK